MARRSAACRRAIEEVDAELNVVPIMGIMCILIPNMLYMFSFHEVTVQRVLAPRAGSAGAAGGGGARPASHELNLTVMIRKDQGFLVSWDESLVDEGQVLPLIPMRTVDAHYCVQGDRVEEEKEIGCSTSAGECRCYDFPALYAELVSKKEAFSRPDKPQEKLFVSADPQLKFDVVSRVMDAAECLRDRPSYATWEEWRASQRKPGDSVVVPGTDRPLKRCAPLFPKIVFALVE